MSRTIAPLLSFSASGQIAKTQVYASWKGRPYVRRYVVPANPNTVAQQATRNAWRWLNDFYRLLPGPAVATWTLAALSRQITDRNMFLKRNLSGFRDDINLDDLEAASVAAGGIAPGTLTVTAGNDQLTIALAVPTLPTDWTITAMHAVATQNVNPVTTSPTQVFYVTDASAPYSVVMTGLASVVEYQVWAWFEYAKANGDVAYSTPQQTQETTT